MTMLNDVSPTRRVTPTTNTNANAPHAGFRQPRVIHRRSTIRPLRMTVIFLLVASTLAVGGLSAAEPALAHGANANGCTGVPDDGYGFSFHGICDRHDRCYGTKPYGTNSAGRRQCDRVFRSEMLGYCDRHSSLSAKRVVCGSVAGAYYGGVRVLGKPFWDRSSPTPIA